jgi:hypothetical protein
MPLVEPTNSLLKKMLANGIDGLFLQVTNLPGVYESAILPREDSTLACEIDTHQLSHTLGEDVRGLHVRLAKEKHSYFHNVLLSGIGGNRTMRLLQALVCRCLRVVIRGHGRIAFSSFITMRNLSLGGARGTLSLGIVGPEAIAGEGALCVIHRDDFVFINVAPANDDGQIRGLREVNLSDESLHDPQRFGQGPSIQFIRNSTMSLTTLLICFFCLSNMLLGS